jgi:hypothetical protein
MSVHLYDSNSGVYNLLFHPLHSKQKEVRAVSVITVIFLTIVTGGLWQIPFWIINQFDDKKLKKWNDGSSPKTNDSSSKTHDVSLRRLSIENDISGSMDEIPQDQEDLSQEETPRLGKLQPLEIEVSEPLPQVTICPEITKTLDQLFVGSSYSIDALPIFPKVPGSIWADLPARLDMEHPIMKGVDSQGTPFIVIKMDKGPEDQVMVLTQYFVHNPLDWGQITGPNFIYGPFTNRESGELDQYSANQFEELRSLIVNGKGADQNGFFWTLGK